MLQTNRAQASPGIPAADPQLVPENLHSFASFVRRQLPLIAVATVVALMLGLIYLVTARPSYTAEAQLLIDARKLQVFQQQSILGDIPVDTAQVESQVEVLRSDTIGTAVIQKLHLTEDGEFVGSYGGLLGALIKAVATLVSPVSDVSDREITQQALRNFQSRLNIKRLGATYVIKIGFTSYDPNKAAQIANAVADAYIVDQLDSKYQATRRAGTWLQGRLAELRGQLADAERAVVEFKTKNNIISTGGEKGLLGEQQVAELNSQLVIARANTADSRARLDRIESVLKADATNASISGTVTDTLKNDVVSKLRSQYLELAAREADWSVKYGPNHVAVINLRNQMREIQNSIREELKRLAETYKSDYAIAKQREIGVQQELAQAVSLSQATDAKAVMLRDLQSTAQSYKSLYNNFLQRYMESLQQQSFPITEARVISAASRPLQKSSPKALLVLIVAGIGGVAFGLGIGTLRDMGDRVFRTGAQVENSLHADCLALVPLFTPDTINQPADGGQRVLKPGAPGGKQPLPTAASAVSASLDLLRSIPVISDLRGSLKSTRRKVDMFAAAVAGPKSDAADPAPAVHGRQQSSETRTIRRTSGTFWPVADAPLSHFTESIRSIKLANDLKVSNNRIIGVTSALPDEGKSTIAFSLAQLISQVGPKTVLIDCDLRNPSLSRGLAPDASFGLFDAIIEKKTIGDVVWKDPTGRLSFLPAVVKVTPAHSSEILASGPTKAFFDRLKQEYEYIVVDLPPLAPIVDVRATNQLVDSFVFVIEWGRTKIDVVEHTLAHAENVYDNLLGVVLNKVDMDVFGRYASDRESYYYNKNYSRYGYNE